MLSWVQVPDGAGCLFLILLSWQNATGLNKSVVRLLAQTHQVLSISISSQIFGLNFVQSANGH